jgi:hypothetical protein
VAEIGLPFPSSLAGLTRQSILFSKMIPAKKMDARVKPAHDAVSARGAACLLDLAGVSVSFRARKRASRKS